MAKGAIWGWGKRIRAGIAIAKLDEDVVGKQIGLPSFIRYYQASHPVPDERSRVATQAVKTMLAQVTEQDHVLCLISGGASALLTDPVLPMGDWRALNEALLHAGCVIDDVNVVRQHFDGVKGGGLLGWIMPAFSTTLILSDVIGNNMAYIGSGPTVPIVYDVARVKRIFERYGVLEKMPASTRQAIVAQLEDDAWCVMREETTTHHALRTTHHIIGDVGVAARAAAAVAAQHGYDVEIVATDLVGEAADVGRRLAGVVGEMPAKSVKIYGGETTVTVGENAGKGGRNQELALAGAMALADKSAAGTKNGWLATLATDGEDGNNPAAGAIVNGNTIAHAEKQGLNAQDYLNRHDSYAFFQQLGTGHVNIGSTGTNVNDLTILVKS
jgi:hydroxypyruvate reductase